MPAVDTATLIVRLATTSDPLLLWAIHVVLDKRDIPPCLRWPENDADEQMEFITFAADLLWIARRYPNHVPAYRGWRAAFGAPASPAWHATLHRQYLWITSRYPIAHRAAKGLALTNEQRQDLIVIKTNAMTAARRDLEGERFEATRQALLEHAMTKPDKSGKRHPSAVANRRVAMWRVHVLCGRKVSKTATNWTRITGEPITRQAIAKQIEIVRAALREQA